MLKYSDELYRPCKFVKTFNQIIDNEAMEVYLYHNVINTV